MTNSIMSGLLQSMQCPRHFVDIPGGGRDESIFFVVYLLLQLCSALCFLHSTANCVPGAAADFTKFTSDPSTMSSVSANLNIFRRFMTVKPHVPLIKFRKGGPSTAGDSTSAAASPQPAAAAPAGRGQLTRRLFTAILHLQAQLCTSGGRCRASTGGR